MRKTWFITGAAHPLGADIVKAALAQGDCIVATDGDASALCLAHACADDRRLLALPLDVADGRAVTGALRLAVEHFGGLDVVVHAQPRTRPVGTAERGAAGEFVRGVFNVTRAALPIMQTRRGGEIHHVLEPDSPSSLDGPFSIAGFCAAVANDVAPAGIVVTAVDADTLRGRLFTSTTQGEGELLEQL